MAPRVTLREVALGHGPAPLRLRVENQLGFKQFKWIKDIEFVHHLSEPGAGQGGYNEDHEFYGYRDEIGPVAVGAVAWPDRWAG